MLSNGGSAGDETSGGEGSAFGSYASAPHPLGPWRVQEAAVAYGGEAALSNGSLIGFVRRERPQLLFDTRGNPTHLFNGVCPEGYDKTQDGSQPHHCFTFAQRIDETASPPGAKIAAETMPAASLLPTIKEPYPPLTGCDAMAGPAVPQSRSPRALPLECNVEPDGPAAVREQPRCCLDGTTRVAFSGLQSLGTLDAKRVQVRAAGAFALTLAESALRGLSSSRPT